MANTIAFDLTSALKTLAPTFQTAVNASIAAESEPLKRTQAQKDLVNVRRNIYTDMKSNLSLLQTSVQALITTQASFGLTPVLKSSVVPTTAGSSVFTASNTTSAVAGDYDIIVAKLAKAQARATVAAASPDLALGKSGTFLIGGAVNASIGEDFEPTTSVTSVIGTGLAADGQRQLGSGEYSLQVRDDNGVRQFRLVNADGTAVSIKSQSGTGYTSSWQAMSDDANYDTGRGLKLSLSTAGDVGSTKFDYTAKGTAITIYATDTQRNIASAINAAVQPEGRDFKASIIAGQLVISATQTGTNHDMVYSDEAGLGFGAYDNQKVFHVAADLQAAQNAEFTVNGMSVSRASNTNLDDVIDGVTLNIAGDAEDKSARLSIAGSNDKSITAMNSLVTNFNAAFTHLTGKLGSTSTIGADGKTSYTRGPLTGDTIFRSLRGEMLDTFNNNATNSGIYKNLTEIGMSFDKNLKLSLDSAKFNEALKSHPTDVAALLDAAMGNFNTALARHTGTTGLLQNTLSSIDDQLKGLDQRINKLNDSLDGRKKSLITQYQAIQSQLADIGYEAQMFGINISGGSVTGSLATIYRPDISFISVTPRTDAGEVQNV